MSYFPIRGVIALPPFWVSLVILSLVGIGWLLVEPISKWRKKMWLEGVKKRALERAQTFK